MKPRDFWASVESRIVYEPMSGCWLWAGSVASTGYGTLAGRVDGRSRPLLAHRVVYEAIVGPIPDGLTLDHLCRNTLCVSPWHLDPVTRAENTRRQHAARTHCKNGHPFDEANTYLGHQGGTRSRFPLRQCRICRREWGRAYRLRMKEQAI